MPGAFRQARRNPTRYQQVKVTCLCRQCWQQSEGRGFKIPKYTARRHAVLYPRTGDLPQTLDPRYRAQPFGRPNPTTVPATTAATAAVVAGTAIAPIATAAADRPFADSPPESPAHLPNVEPDFGGGIDLGGYGAEGIDLDYVEFAPNDLETGQGSTSTQESTNREDPAHTRRDLWNPGVPEIPPELTRPSYVFPPKKPVPRPQEVLENSDVSLLWRIIMLLVTWLHLTYHLPHRGCDLILRILHLIFSFLNAFPDDSDPILSLRSVFRRFRLDDSFLVLPICPNCGKVALPYSPIDSLCSDCSGSLFDSSTTTSRNQRSRKPILGLPYNSLTHQITDLLNREGMERAVEEWRSRERNAEVLQDIMDGEIWKTIPGPDGKPFFDNDPNRLSKDEIRIGITLGFDGFGYQTSRSAASYSSDVLSCCIANLPIQLKCLTRNLLILCIYPGPKAPDWKQTQQIMVYVVDELIQLFQDGVRIPTLLHPEGRLVRVALVAVCCDHPALCRMVGFADHSHEKRFCTRCTIPHKELRTENGLKNGYAPRTGEEHRENAFKFLAAGETERSEIFEKEGARYTELARLPYFDAVRMTVIDPMHNMLLGIMRSQWHDSLVKTDCLRRRTEPKRVPRELDLLNRYLNEFEMPSWVGRLPSEVGYPAAGSLSADEYKALLLVYLPLILPFIWEEWQPVARKEYEKKVTNWQKKEASRRRRVANGKARKGDDSPSPKPILRMHEQEADNFLNLSAALKIILSRSILQADLPRARFFFEKYLQIYLKIHAADVKPNFHWAVHIFDQIRDYGPVYGFWSFTNERLNKLLKSYNTNNHGAGEIETSFMREHVRDARIRDLVLGATRSEDYGLREATSLLVQTDSDNRGTVAGMARELDEAANEASQKFSLGSGAQELLPTSLQQKFLKFYDSCYPLAGVCSRTARIDTSDPVPANFLRDKVTSHKFIILNGRRIVPSTNIYKANNSIVQARFGTSKFVGQVHDIFTHFQPPLASPSILLHVRWFEPLRPGVFNSILWSERSELEVAFFEFDSYLDPAVSGPPSLITPDDIVSQACRVRILYHPQRDEDDKDEEEENENDYIRIWATIGLTKDAITI